MTSKKYLLGIDFGTESIRAGLFDLHGRAIKISSHAYPIHFPRPGWAEQDPLDWLDALKKSVNDCIEDASIKGKDVMALSVAATSATVVPSDAEGNPLRNAILWMDSRAHREVEEIANTNHNILYYAGGKDAVEWMVPKALWIKKNESEIYKKADRMFDSLDWILYRLTKRWTASMCNATVAWNYVSTLGGWAKDFFKDIGLGDIIQKWPEEILFMGDYVAGLTTEAADWLGLQPGIPVAEGGIDSHAGMIGLGVVRPGTLAMIIGSSTAHLMLSNKEISIQGVWGPYPEAVIRKLWLIQGGQNSTGSVINWFKNNFAYKSQLEAQSENKEVYKILDKKAKQIPPGSQGVLVLDYWQGNRSPYRDPLARGTITGLTLGHSEAHLFRAIMEGTAYGTRNILEHCLSSGLFIDEIRACGGGVKSSLWLQIHADVCNIPIYITEVPDASALGAAICAAVGGGIYSSIDVAADKMVRVTNKIEPNTLNTSVYDFYYQKYKDAYVQLKDIMREMSKYSQE